MADNPIDLSKILKFDDTTPIDQVIVKMGQVNTLLETMLQTAQKSAAGMTQSMQAIQKSVESLEQEINEADATTKKGQDTINKGATTAANAVAQNEEYKKSLAELTTTIKMLQEQIDKLSESNKKVPKDNDAQKNSLTDLRKQLKDATDAYSKMGDQTEASIKQKALKNIQDLGKATADAAKTLSDAKKGSDVASGSYNDLAKKVADATKQLKAMEGGIGSNSQQFKNLQKFVSDGNEKLKKFDEVIGVNNRNVGNYTESIEKAVPAFKMLSPELAEVGESVKAFGKQLLALLANPIVLGIAALIGAFALLKKSLDTYIEGTVEGADKANTFSQKWSTALEVVDEHLKEAGKSVLQFIAGNKEGELPNWLKATIVNLPGGIALLAEYNLKLQQNVDISKKQNDLRKEEIVLVTEVSELELTKEQKLFEARDKENRSLQERYNAIVEVNKVRLEEVELKKKSAQAEFDIQAAYFKKIGVIITNETKIKDLFENERVIQLKSYEQVEALANARAKITNAQKEEFEGTRRIQALENQLLDEAVAKQLAGIKEEKSARDKYNMEVIAADQDANNRILVSQGSFFHEKIDAEVRNLADTKQLNDKSLSEELASHRESAMSRIILDKKTNDEINAQSRGDLEVRAKLVIDAKNKVLDDDQAFNSQIFAIEESYRIKNELAAKQSADRLVKLNLDTHRRLAETDEATTGIASDQSLISLDESLKNRKISLNKYNLERQRIETQAKNDQLDIQNDQLKQDLDYYTSSEELANKFADEISRIRKKIADNELQIEDNNTKIIIQKRQRLHDLEKQLANETLDAIAQIGQNETQTKLDHLEVQMKASQDAESREMSLASSNQTLKIQLSNQFAEQQAKLLREENKLKHDQAIKDRTLGEAKIIINTAVAISEVLPNLIAAALIGAMGALQLATVASTPIPAYFTGTNYSKQGWATVGERGAELAFDRSGKVDLYDKPQLTYLNEGTKILNASETQPILQKLDAADMRVTSKQLVDIGIRDLKVAQGVNKEIISRLDKLNDTTKKNKPSQINYAKVGAIVYEFKKEEETYIKRIKALSFGSWL